MGFLASVMSIVGCGSKALKSSGFPIASVDGMSESKVVYYLPKVVVKATITYSTIGTTTYVQGVAGDTSFGNARIKAIRLEPVLSADRRRVYAVDAASLSDVSTLQSKLTLTLSSDGRIAGVGFNSTDNTLKVVENIIGTAIGIAKIAVMFDASGPDPASPLRKMQERAATLAGELAAGGPADAMAEKRKQLDALNNLIDLYAQRNRTERAEVTLDYVAVIDPQDGASITAGPVSAQISYATATKPASDPVAVASASAAASRATADARVADDVLGAVNDVVTDPKAAKEASEMIAKAIKDQAVVLNFRVPIHAEQPASVQGSSAGGIVVAVPVLVAITATVGEVPVVESTLSMPQFGPTVVLPVASKAFATRNVTIEFSPDTGTPTKIDFDSGSGADKLAESIKKSVTDLQTAIGEIKTSTSKGTDMQKRTDLLAAETKVIDAERTKLEAEQKLEEARKKSKNAAVGSSGSTITN